MPIASADLVSGDKRLFTLRTASLISESSHHLSPARGAIQGHFPAQPRKLDSATTASLVSSRVNY
jgi:hypothetical protein